MSVLLDGNDTSVSTARPTTQIQREKWNTARARQAAFTSTLRVLGVGADDVPHQPVAHHVGVAEVAEADPLDAPQDPLHLQHAALLATRKDNLRVVTRSHRARDQPD